MNSMTILNLLATAAPAAGEMNYLTTGAIAAVCSMVSGLVLYGKGKQNRNVTLTNQPVGVKVEEAYVTRIEFTEFRGEMRTEVRDMKGLFDKAVTLIAERDSRLTEKMEAIASGAYEARRRIHETVNRQGERLAQVETKADIGKGLGNLGKAIMAANKSS